MRIALLYPPPWKVAGPDEARHTKDGPPEGYREGDLDADFYQTPYGLFALGAQAIRAGHQVKVLNLSSYPWSKVEEIVQKLDADVWGMSCWTANRRGVRLVSECIKRHHPNAHVVVGGPHATPLGPELLGHYPHVDTVCLGESDITFLELVSRLSKGLDTKAIAGTVYRDDGRVVTAPERKNVSDLDALASPQEYFDTHIMMTSRGCPWACTFCGAETSWGRGFRANSIDYVLSAMEKVTSRLPVRMIQIKDDTFTTNKKRVLEMCRKMRERNLGFFWSCDTRVDLLSDELLREMRLAGCQRLSLGVESGSQEILDKIDKKITPQEIIESTELAKKYGIKVRYYMMLGNRGETKESFAETLRFLERAKPHEYVFSCLSIYPGTRDFYDAEKAGWLNRSIYFERDFQEYKTPFDASEDTMRVLNEWFFSNHGLQIGYRDTTADYECIAERLGDYHAAHMDLGAAYYHEGKLDLAERHVRKALELGYPCPGLALNHLACIAKARGDIEAMMDLFMKAAKTDPQHWVLIQNVNAARAWFKKNGPAQHLPLELVVRHDFQLLERTMQPTLPGPLPEDYAEWRPALAPAPLEAAEEFVKTPDLEGSKKGLDERKRLPVV
ncbi:Radical SAM domain protein [Labilithrix luteola]|uniref:Radical SAM domain protein n=1 Tax=Labilithrix luteola TaxID=1391654 RepID=A0A0K1Q566_9BACT|nr:radical SAM protein [Labilithrix luteola]AKV00792.1 Radical SAM domain protein [Labilithrix luteola]